MSTRNLPDKLQFPIESAVRYQSLRRGRISVVGAGKTLRISSREVRFTTESALSEGERVRLAVEWPALLDSACLMTLQICGQVSRSLPGAAAVTITRYEFRTRGAALRVAHFWAA